MSDLPDPIKEVGNLLVTLGFANKKNDCLRLNGLALYRYRGCWVLAEPACVIPTLYFGSDSIALASRLAPINGCAALDLCAGPGIQTLILAAAGMHVTSVEINLFALRLLEANASLNLIKEPIDERQGDLFSCIDDAERYDVITANPPLLPIPKGIPYPFVGDGGSYGLDVTLQIVAKAGLHLTSTGYLQTIGITTITGIEITQEKLLKQYLKNAGLDAVLTIIQQGDVSSGSLWNKMVAETSWGFAPRAYRDYEQAEKSVSDRYKALGVDGVCSYTLRAWKGNGALQIIDLSDPSSCSLSWFITKQEDCL